MPQEIRKRDGSVVPFSDVKITKAIAKALSSVGEGDGVIARQLTDLVLYRVGEMERDIPNFVPDVEQIQDMVEIALIEGGYAKAVKSYILYRDEHRRVRDAQKSILNGRTTKLPFSLNALKVVAKRYLRQDEDGHPVEIPEEMFRRVADSLARIEERYGKSPAEMASWSDKFYDVLSQFEFTPAGRTITNAGADTPVVANCIVLHAPDSMEGIFETLKEATLLQQQGSGLGFPFHLIRPAGLRAKRTQGRASGPISFLSVYNTAFGIIQQQNRHGANMAVMRVDHPDILDFVHCKEQEGSLVNFNISVGLTNEFMAAVERDDKEPWMCHWKEVKMYPRRVKRNARGIVEEIIEEKMTAREMFDEIISAAWNNGEPGAVFLDEVNNTNPVPGLGRIEACNPCGEQFLHDGDVCNLGSINLAQFVENGRLKDQRLFEVTKVATRMLDNVIDMYGFAVDRVRRVSSGNRRIGLGVMGFADMLYQLKIGYNSPEGFAMAERVMGIIQEASHEMSRELAVEKGLFPNWHLSIYAPQGIKMRNAALTTVAPTGTIAMMLDASGGVEPFFALAYHYKGILGGNVSLHYVNKYLEAELKARGLYNEQLIEKIIEEGSLQNVDGVPEDMKRVYVTAMDISADDHIKMQASFQKHVDNSISKTCNFRFDATHDDVRHGYLLAWKLKCKGLTVYRDGSREIQVLNLNKDKKKLAAGQPAVKPTVKPAAPQVSRATSMSVQTMSAPRPPIIRNAPPIMSPHAQMSQRGTVTASAVRTAPTQTRVQVAPVVAPVKVQVKPQAITLTQNLKAMSIKDKIKAGICPECDTALRQAEGCKSCPRCGWALCSL